jgi:hypothetical protein
MRKATSALWAALFARPVDPDKEGECPHASQVGFIRRNANVTTPNRARSVPDTGNPESLTVHHTQPYYISESRKSPYDFWAGLADFTISNLFDTIYLYPHFSMICDRNPGLVESAPFGAQSRSQWVPSYAKGRAAVEGHLRRTSVQVWIHQHSAVLSFFHPRQHGALNHPGPPGEKAILM